MNKDTKDEQAICAKMKAEGLTRAEIAHLTGLTPRQVKTRLASAGRDPAVQKVMDVSGTDMVPIEYWDKTERYSVKYRPKQDVQDLEGVADSAIARVMAANIPTPHIAKADVTEADKISFLPLFDAHIGLSVGDYGLTDAVNRLVSKSLEMIDLMPAASELIVLNGGDFTHQNDESNQTPRSKHPLPVDGTYDDATDAGTDALIKIMEFAAHKFGHISHKSLAGNHDPATAKIIRAALRQRYRNVDNIDVDIDGTHFYKRVFGGNLLTSQHGDVRRSAKDIVMGIQSQHRLEFGRAVYCEHHTGHLHHIKETRFDEGGIILCQHAGLTKQSDHEVTNLYDSSSIMQGITYRETGGRVSCFELSMDWGQ